MVDIQLSTHRFVGVHFTVKRPKRSFSKMSLDEGDEQNNVCVKDEGGAIDLTEKQTALSRRMEEGPESSLVDWTANILIQ